MVFIDSTKFACERCIKGHRTSTCKHSDRPLIEIKKKGRPQTQCDHCRTLRQTKSVHVKCLCAPAKGASASMPVSTAHINPEYPQTSSSTTIASELACIQGPECPCCVPRKRSSPNRSKLPPTSSTSAATQSAKSQSSSDSGHESEASFSLDVQTQAHELTQRASTRYMHAHHHSFSPYHRAYETHHYLPPIAGLLNPTRSGPAVVPHELHMTYHPSPFDALHDGSFYDSLPQAEKVSMTYPALDAALLEPSMFGSPPDMQPPSLPPSFDDVDSWVQHLPSPGSRDFAGVETALDPFGNGAEISWPMSSSPPTSWMSVPMLIPTETG